MSKHLPPKKNKHEKEPEPSVLNVPLRERKSSRIKNELTELGWKNYVFIALSAVLLAAALAVGGESWLGLGLFGAAFAAAAVQVILRAVDELLSIQILEADVLVLLASVLSFALGHYAAAVLIVLTYRVLKLAEGYILSSSRKLSGYFDSFLPQTANLVNDRGRVDEIEPEKIAENDILEVRVGEIFPVDGTIIEGKSTVDASVFIDGMNGISVSEGSYVLSGCTNLSSTVRMRAECIYSSSNAAMISELLEKADKYKPRQEKFASKLERFYTPAVVLVSLAVALIFPAFGGQWHLWLSRAAAILALSGCSALAISINYAYHCGRVWAAKKGIVFKATRFFEVLADTQTFVFNKTGTLTEGRYSVVDLVPIGMEEQELLAVAAHAEAGSEHPIARAVCKAYGLHPELGKNVRCEEIPGRGVSSIVSGKHVYVGNAALLAEHSIEVPVPKKGGAAIFVAVNGKCVGYILVADKIREGAFDQLEQLRVQGIKNMVTLTSDVLSVARPLASSLNMDLVRAELNPEGKVSALEYLMATKAERSTLAFVCNGAGDPEALGRADTGISIAALGSPDAYEKGDVLIFSQRLGALSDTMAISRFVRLVGRVNILLCLLAKAVLLILSLTGGLGLTAVVILDFAVALAIYLNSLRVIRFKNDIRRMYR